ncbi:universal stress protein [Streptomyces sp. Lzd4kr]|nr:universal stress protein [Streptomyces sp. Lzd4kr]
MELPLVVDVDGSESSFRAVDWAVDAAARHGLAVRLVHTSLSERYESVDLNRPSELQVAEEVVRAATERARLRNPDVNVYSESLPEDDPEVVLLREARNAWAMVTGRRGRGRVRELLLGSVSLALAARATCPVVVVGGGERSQDVSRGRLVLGVCASAGSSAAVDFAFQEAEVRDCVLEAVRAWRYPAHELVDHPLAASESARYHRQQATELLEAALRVPAREHPNAQVRRVVVEGPARNVLLDRTSGADLLVVGARRRNGRAGLQLGRVSRAVLHHAHCPVAVVPQRG